MNARQRDENLREIARRRAGSDKLPRVTMQIDSAEFAPSAPDKRVPDGKADPDNEAQRDKEGQPDKEAA
jgi:hypothetical protein